MKFTIITKDGSKWLRPITHPSTSMSGHNYEVQVGNLSDLPYLGSRPDGTTVDESEVVVVKQYQYKGEWFDCYNDVFYSAMERRPDIDVRTSCTDAESHDCHIGDDYWNKRCAAAERYIKESPYDHDITKAQRAAYDAWQEIVNQEPGNNDQSV